MRGGGDGVMCRCEGWDIHVHVRVLYSTCTCTCTCMRSENGSVMLKQRRAVCIQWNQVGQGTLGGLHHVM